jgi:AcrR family transcriptional regulator
MARRSEHSQQEIKEMVLNAAEIIVAEEGFSALKVRKIALEIGYTVGSIYMVFDNMDDLFMHIKARTLDDILEQINKAQLLEFDIVELAKVYLDYANNNFNKWSMIFEHRLKRDAEIPEWYQSRVDTLFRHVEDLFSKIDPSRTEHEIKQAARSLWGGVHGVCILSMTGGFDVVRIKDIEESVVLVAECFVKGWAGLSH